MKNHPSIAHNPLLRRAVIRLQLHRRSDTLLEWLLERLVVSESLVTGWASAHPELQDECQRLLVGNGSRAQGDREFSEALGALHQTGNPSAGQRCTVLLLDDDPAFLRSLRRVLASGFHVRTALGVQEARGILTLDDPLDIVVSDYELPGESGLDFLAEVLQTRPHLRRVLMTSRRFDDPHRLIRAGIIDAFLPKPCPHTTLQQTLQRLCHEDAYRHASQQTH